MQKKRAEKAAKAKAAEKKAEKKAAEKKLEEKRKENRAEKAEKGEKTMLDALIPAYEAFNGAIDAGKDINLALNAACEAANEGVEFTKTIAATKGRASYLGDRSIGHQDPGATSATFTLEVIRDFLAN